MNVSLTPQLEEFVRRKVESGLYTSSSEVVREALRLLEQRDRTRQQKLEELRQAIREGVESGDAGEFDAEAIIERRRRRRDAARSDQQ